MKNFACWRADDVERVINPDADALPNYIFLAVHTETHVQVRSSPNAPATMVSGQELLERFLGPQDHVLVPFVGESGTGKSHLIRWMHVRLPDTQGREVIFVPKAQTNLRQILRELAQRLPEQEKEQFLAELQGTGDSLNSSKAQRTAVLNEIHTALQNDEVDPNADDPELEAYLLEGMRAVFIDHNLRENHFLGNGTFAADLAAHVFERPATYMPAEQRRAFTAADLPLTISSVEKSGYEAREFLAFLLAQSDAVRAEAAKIVDRHVDRAISRCLNITGDRLIDLMLSIRRRLKDEGKSLILLIEDFARLQGLDRALLQSLIEQRDDLCVLRTAFACTTGFYYTVAETVRTRLTFIVDMDAHGEDEAYGGIDLKRLTARYMNALRCGSEDLRAQYEAHGNAPSGYAVANPCDACEHRSICHGTFGEVDGVGLYPFTRRAIETMVARLDSETQRHFPRTFQQYILRPIAREAPNIEAGRFPTVALLKSLGGVQGLPATEQRKLEKVDLQNYERRLALLQLWDGGQTAKTLHPDLQRAFGLEPISLGKDTSDPKPAPKPPPQPRPPQVDSKIEELEAWYNEHAQLSQTTANTLRPLLYDALNEFIDWDSIGYRMKGLEKRSFYFVHQSTTRTQSFVALTIPADWADKEERFQTLMALRGLIEADQRGDWNIPDASEKLACLLELLRRLSDEVVKQFQTLEAASVDWDPAGAAFMARATMAVLTGADVRTDSNLGLIRAGLGSLGSGEAFANQRLTRVVEFARTKDETLRNAIKARRSAMKGATQGAFIDSHALLGPASALRSARFIPPPPPDEVAPRSQELKDVEKTVRCLADELPAALREEAELRLEWVGEMDSAFGTDAQKLKIVKSVKKLIDCLGGLGLSTGDLPRLREDFRRSNFEGAMSATRDLPEPEQLTPHHVTTPVVYAMKSSRDLVKELTARVERAEIDLEAKLRLKGVDPDAERTVISEIYSALSGIEHQLQVSEDVYTS